MKLPEQSLSVNTERCTSTISSNTGGEIPHIPLTEINVNNKQTAIEELPTELQMGEDGAKEKGYIDTSDVEKILKAK